MQDPAELSLAIVGMSGRFPDAENTDQFWQNVVSNKKSLRSFTCDELQEEGIPCQLLENKQYVRAGAPLERIADFDVDLFGYTPQEAALIDPQQRLFLECAWEALEHAGYALDSYEGNAGIFAGASFNSYLLKNILTRPDILQQYEKRLIGIGNEKDALTSLAAYKLNIRGPVVTLQTFSSTSLVAVHFACQSLLQRECDLALAGGVSVAIPRKKGYLAPEGGLFSPDGECYAFDQRAHGYVAGSGVAIVVLKRLCDALHDGDTIYALIKGTAINNDGQDRSTFGSPSVHGQTRVIAEALANAGILAETIQYIEAHGFSTALGDAIELAAMQRAFRLQTQKQRFCALGSVKPNIGHLECAAGVTGLIKTALALVHRILPPQLNCEQPLAEIDQPTSFFYVQRSATLWPENQGNPRRAGVSSFGLGGTNAHVILEEAPHECVFPTMQYWYLLILSAQTTEALQKIRSNLALYLQNHPSVSLADVAYTLQFGRRALRYRTYILCHQLEEAIAVLNEPLLPIDSFHAVRSLPKEQAIGLINSDKGVSMQKEYQSQYTFLQIIAETWSSGHVVDWKQLYGDERRRHIPLPTYPFERRRCWIEAASFRRYFTQEDLAVFYGQL